ncbi:MAG: hypothetical protein MZV64_24085 [Ignavibacteriales bacterium]|nr:hypothetical protein [Ignavibacteriales bacterium]
MRTERITPDHIRAQPKGAVDRSWTRSRVRGWALQHPWQPRLRPASTPATATNSTMPTWRASMPRWCSP